MIQQTEGEPGVPRRALHVGDFVHYRLPTTTKLQRPWSDPIKVVSVKGPTTVEVEKHGTVHINRLKFFKAASPVVGEKCGY